MKPTIGRIVIYNTTDAEQKAMSLNSLANVQKQLPAMIVAVWSDNCVNLRIIADGNPNADMWKMSVLQGDNENNWNWPVINP